MVSIGLGKIFLIGMVFTFAVGISFGVRRRRAQLGLTDKD